MEAQNPAINDEFQQIDIIVQAINGLQIQNQVFEERFFISIGDALAQITSFGNARASQQFHERFNF